MKNCWLACVVVAWSACADVTISEDTTLSADTDWRDQGTVVVADGVTLNLGGHKFYVSALGGNGTIDGTGKPAFKYYRFKVEDTRGTFLQVSELKLYNGDTDVTGQHIALYSDTTTVTDDTLAPTVAAGRITPDAEKPEKLVDGEVGTKWLDFRSDPRYSAEIRAAAWVTLEFPDKTQIDRYEWYTANDTQANPGRNPTTWRLQGSDDNASWADLDVQVDRGDLTTESMKLAYSGVPGLGTGELHVDVPSGVTAENASVSLVGRLKLVKDGAGELVAKKAGQTYAGGTLVAGGTLALPMSSDQNEWSPVRFTNPFGASPQPITVATGATVDWKGNYDTEIFAVTLAGGTIANLAKDMLRPDYGLGAPYRLTADSFADFAYTFAWGSTVCDLGGHLLSVRLADDKYFYLKAQSLNNGRVIVSNDGSHAGRFVVLERNDSQTTSFDIAANLEIKADFLVRDLVTRQPGTWGWSETDRKIAVQGVFKPVTDFFPNVQLQDGARIDLTERTEPWSVRSLDILHGTEDHPFLCSFADNATIVVDVRGRELALGDKIVSWDTMPSNFSTLTFKFDTGEEELVLGAAAGEGVYYGVDPNSREVAKALWTGAVSDDISDPANWVCENIAGVTLADALPMAGSFVLLSGNLRINLPASAAFACKGLQIDDCALVADSDLSGLTAVLDGTAALDLKGHRLILSALTGFGTVTDSVGGGELRLLVPEGATLDNTATAFSGAFTLVKDGAGTFVATRASQAYTGGTRVVAGTVRPGTGDGSHPFGAQGSEIVVEEGATFDAGDKLVGTASTIVSQGGRLLLPSTGSVDAPDFDEFHYVRDAVKVADNEIQITKNQGNSVGAAYWTKRVNPALPWRATFTYKTVDPNNPADGFAFILQNAAAGLDAIGGTGGSLAVNDISPSFGTAYNIYQGDSVGWIVDGGKNGMNGNLNGVALDQGADIVVEYDGHGMMFQTITRGDSHVSFRYAIDLAAKLGTSAWVGFTGACGGASCDQRIADFTFTTLSPADLDLAFVPDAWQLNGNAALETYDGQAALRVTEAKADQVSASSFLRKLPVGRAFRLSGTYVMAAGSDKPADGVGFVFHNNAPTGIGRNGSGRGFNGGNEGANLSTCCGWSFNIYGDQRLDFVKNAASAQEYALKDSGIVFTNKRPVDFEITSRNGRFSITITQDGATYTAEQTFDPAAHFGADAAFFAVTGACGGQNSLQYVYNLVYASLEEETGYNGAVVHAAKGTTMTIDIREPAVGGYGLSALTLVDDTTVSVGASGLGDADYDLVVGQLALALAQGASQPSVVLAPNGSGTGTLRLGSVVYPGPGSKVRIVGAVKRANPEEKICIVLPTFKGAVPLIDLKDATGVTLDDFELVTSMTTRCELKMWGNVLYAVGSDGMAIFFR